jgi:hypothetical protein
MNPNVKLMDAESPFSTNDIAIGSPMYALLGTQPDIAFAVQTLSRFISNPGIVHWETIKRIFHYLKGTHKLWLMYRERKVDLEEYANANGSMMEDRRAISGYAFMIHGGAILWSAKRQEIVSFSITESEYIAATYAKKEALWLCTLILQPFSLDLDTTTLYSDNQLAIALSKEYQYHACMKDINVHYHVI